MVDGHHSSAHPSGVSSPPPNEVHLLVNQQSGAAEGHREDPKKTQQFTSKSQSRLAFLKKNGVPILTIILWIVYFSIAMAKINSIPVVDCNFETIIILIFAYIWVLIVNVFLNVVECWSAWAEHYHKTHLMLEVCAWLSGFFGTFRVTGVSDDYYTLVECNHIRTIGVFSVVNLGMLNIIFLFLSMCVIHFTIEKGPLAGPLRIAAWSFLWLLVAGCSVTAFYAFRFTWLQIVTELVIVFILEFVLLFVKFAVHAH